MHSSTGPGGDLPVPISRWPRAGEMSHHEEDTESALTVRWSPNAEVALVAAAEAGQMLLAERKQDRFVVSTTRVMDLTDPDPADVERQSAGPARNALDALRCAMFSDSAHPWRHRMTRSGMTMSAAAMRLVEKAESPGVMNGAALTSDLTVGETVHLPSRVTALHAGAAPGWRSNLWVHATLNDLAAGLRRGAKGSAATRAAVGLVSETGWLHGHRGWHFGGAVQAREPGRRARYVDWVGLHRRADSIPATPSEQAVLKIAASLAGGGPVDLAVALAALTRRDRASVRRALHRATQRRRRHPADALDRLVGPPPSLNYDAQRNAPVV
jgi:hypothetical protein